MPRPDRVEEFTILRPLGEGGQGEVYAGYDTRLSRSVAVKFIVGADAHRRERFLIEARAAAQLEHVNVVRIYHYGEHEGEPFLVSELLSGKTLKELEAPLGGERLLHVALGLANGLGAAHRRGILHRDVKPSNAMLTDTGEVKLIDFGIAKFVDRQPMTLSGGSERPALTGAGTPPGTPGYMAPEIVRGEPATARSDVWSLGALLHDLCVGASGRRDRSARDLLLTDPMLGGIVEQCLREDPGERFASGEELAAALAEVAGVHVPGDRNPYRGLRPFEEQHNRLFFGRDAEAREVVERLQERRLVVVAGDSGVGKSSLCRAGVVPAVRRGALGERAIVVRCVPGEAPVRSLVETFAPLTRSSPDAISALLRAEPSKFPDELRQPFGTVLLLIDQLEELFTVAPGDEAAVFARVLGVLAACDKPLRILVSVRGDFFTRLAGLPGLGELILAPGALVVLQPMSEERLRETVEGPARQANVTFESPDTVEALVKSAVTLPLLQFTMAQLWDARDRAARRIPARALERIGGVAGALARHADEVIAPLSPDQRAAARRILLRMITPQGTRKRTTADELTGGQPDARAALEVLLRGRLVVGHEDGGGEYEVSHEALLIGWGTLRAWIQGDGDRRLLRARIVDATSDWQQHGQRLAHLWDSQHLQEAARVDRAELDTPQLQFLDASARRVRRARMLRALLFVAGPLLLIAAIAGVRWRTRAELDAAASKRLANGFERLAEAHRLDEQARRVRGEALPLFASSRSSDEWQRARTAWRGVEETLAAADAAYERAELGFESARAIDPLNAQASTAVADVLFRRARLARFFGDGRVSDLHARRLAALAGASGPLFAPARLFIDVKGATVRVARFQSDHGKARLVDPRDAGEGPLSLELAAGSWLLTFRDGRSREVRLPVMLEAGESVSVDFTLPEEIPDGFVFVPPGRFVAGIAGNDEIRVSLGATPFHVAETGAYLIARHEVTFAEYIAFLETLGPEQVERRMPRHKSLHGALELRKVQGVWELMLQATVHPLLARWGEPIRYPKRSVRAEQDWRRFPVSAISLQDAEAYAAWLGQHVPGAHVCNDLEWERAARGADGRVFTTGDVLDASEVNIDETYGREPWSFGPDEVGSHPESASVFGVEDMVGNAMELVLGAGWMDRASERGGGWYHDEFSARLPARFVVDETMRSSVVGFRICASVDAL